MSLKMEEYYQKYGPMVFRRCFRLLKDKEKAADAHHEVFTKLIAMKITNLAAPSSYFFTAATRVCLNIIRFEKKFQVSEGKDLLTTIAGMEDIESQYEAKSLLKKLFSRLPALSRVIATLYFVDKFTLEEVASETGLTVPKIRYRLEIMKKKLESIYQEKI